MGSVVRRVPRSHPPISVGGATRLSRDMTEVAKGIMGTARVSFSLFSSSASGKEGPFLVWRSYLGLPTSAPQQLVAVHPLRFWLVPFYVAI